MKSFLFLMGFLCLQINAMAQSPAVENFYNEYRHAPNVIDLNFHGEIIKFAFQGEDKSTGDLIERISQLRIMIMEDKNIVKKGDYRELVSNLKDDRFEELMTFREGGSDIEILLREKGAIITDVILLLNGDDEFIMLSLEGLFRFEDLNDLNLNIEGSEHLQNLPDKRKDVPRA